MQLFQQILFHPLFLCYLALSLPLSASSTQSCRIIFSPLSLSLCPSHDNSWSFNLNGYLFYFSLVFFASFIEHSMHLNEQIVTHVVNWCREDKVYAKILIPRFFALSLVFDASVDVFTSTIALILESLVFTLFLSLLFFFFIIQLYLLTCLSFSLAHTPVHETKMLTCFGIYALNALHAHSHREPLAFILLLLLVLPLVSGITLFLPSE